MVALKRFQNSRSLFDTVEFNHLHLKLFKCLLKYPLLKRLTLASNYWKTDFRPIRKNLSIYVLKKFVKKNNNIP